MSRPARTFHGDASATAQAVELLHHYRSYLEPHAALRMARRHAATLRSFDPAVARALRALVKEHTHAAK